ncbi:hypothetical protein POM88_029155 [Heracleum sosnowskyi]|uniref:Uncharacterized protein n=1 Tax=Heracleum sosnowskyi TaxID=360622 RepID=A0AAD8MHH5_9APIA|nr:hypothetical protein POM88_029155 [Heracleum sosnowskyi]
MYASSLGIQERRLNEFYAMQYALRKAFVGNFNLLELESDHAGAYWEWRHSCFNGAIPEHEFILRQLNTRNTDKNSTIHMNTVEEIWYEDMGLGPVGPKFDTIRESDLQAAMVNDDDIDVLDEEEMVQLQL